MTKTDGPQAIAEDDLDQAQGGVGLLLPAVSAAREAARKTKDGPSVTDGTSNTFTGGVRVAVGDITG